VLTGGHRDRDRVGAQQHLDPTPGGHVVRIADGQVEPDHVPPEGHRCVEGRRAGVVAPPHANPADARAVRLRDSDLRRPAEDQVPHAVVAIEQGGGGVLLHHPHRGPQVDPAGQEPARVLGKPEDAVTVGSASVGRDHQLGAAPGVLEGKSGRGKDSGGEFPQPLRGDAVRRRGLRFDTPNVPHRPVTYPKDSHERRRR